MRPVGDMDSGLDALPVKGILAFWDCYNKIQWIGGLINFFFFFFFSHSSGDWQVQDQGTSRYGIW